MSQQCTRVIAVAPFAAALVLLAGCASAPEPAPTTGASAPAPTTVATATTQTDPVVCKVEQMTGSRLRAQRVCKRASDWAEEERMARDLGTRVQDAGSLEPIKEH